MYRKYPYTNFHDINLDYILAKIKVVESKIDEVEELASDWQITIDNINANLDAINNLYNSLAIDNENFKKEVTDNFNTLTNEVSLEFNRLRNSIDEDLSTYITSINYTINSFSNEVASMNRRLDDALANLWMDMKMINPFTGQEDGVLNVIDYLASLHMADGITALDYDALELTAQVYDDKELTAKLYDTEANILLRQ